jgi:hypothetical protein
MNEYILHGYELLERLRELEADEEELHVDELVELNDLRDLRDQWPTPDNFEDVTLIHEDYFEQYAKEFAEDLGLFNDNTEWPFRHINWNRAADELQMDYYEVDYRGESYYGR